MEEIVFTVDICKMNGDMISFIISEQEVDYILQQIKFNQPFVIIVEDEVFSFSPSCCEVHIKPQK